MKKFKVFALIFAIMLSATGLGILFGANQPASTQAKVSADETTTLAPGIYTVDSKGNKTKTKDWLAIVSTKTNDSLSVNLSSSDGTYLVCGKLPDGVTSLNKAFSDKSWLTDIVFTDSFDTSKVTDMGEMFYECRSLASLNLSGFNASNVTNMDSMFYDCRLLTSLDLSKFNTSNVIKMSDMFFDCNQLTEITFPQNFGLPTADGAENDMNSMNGMFSNCSALTSLDLSNFDTSNVTYMWRMFSGCKSLQNIKMPNAMDANSDITIDDLYLLSQNASGEVISWYSLASGDSKGTLVTDANVSVSAYAGNILTTNPNKSYDAINAETFTPAKPETPSTGVVLDVVLPVASIVLVLASLVAVAFVGKKKKQ